MTGRLATVPEESADGSAAAYPPQSLYRDSIRRVVMSRRQVRFTIFSDSRSDYSGSSYSGSSGCSSHSASSGSSRSAPSNSSRSRSAAAEEFAIHQLQGIATQMVRDGYIRRMFEALDVAIGSGGSTCLDVKKFLSLSDLRLQLSPMPAIEYGDGPYRVLETWFLELDVPWVLQIRQEHGSEWQLRLQDNLQHFVERWIRGLTVIIHSLNMNYTGTAFIRFGEASIFKMHVFVDAMIPALKAENLQAVLDMYKCVCWAFDYMEISRSESLDWNSVLRSLFVAVYKLQMAISSTMEKVRTLLEDDDMWAMEILRGGGQVHRNTRWFWHCILSLRDAGPSSDYTRFLDLSDDAIRLRIDTISYLKDLRVDTIRYLKDLLIRKSKLCSDPSLRCLFLLNNSHSVRKVTGLCIFGQDECEKYMDSYLDVSWGHVMSCIPKSHFPGPLGRLINTSPLAKFESAFHQTYQNQKLWKVQDPQLRALLRKVITERVISRYRDYLRKHPEIEKQVNGGSNSPKVLKKMLEELFEG